MKVFAAIILMVLLCGTGPTTGRAQDVPQTLKLPPEVRGATGTPIKVKAETSAKRVRWKTFDPALRVLDRTDLADPLAMIVFSCKPGRYTLYAWAVAGEDATDLVPCQVVVEGDGPAPPPPPGPDPLAEALEAAYRSDADPLKASRMMQLAAVWRLAVGLAATPTDATVGELLARIRKASAATLEEKDANNPTYLVLVRRRIAEELRANLPTTMDAPLDKDTAAKAAALFGKIANILEKLK